MPPIDTGLPSKRSVAPITRAQTLAGAAPSLAAGLAIYLVGSAKVTVLLDVDLPGCSGPELQARLATRADVPPIVFLTGKGDIAGSVKAIKAGAEENALRIVREAESRSALLLAVAGEVLVGLALGFVLQLSFAAPIIAAEVGCLIRDRYRREHKAAVRARTNRGAGQSERGP